MQVTANMSAIHRHLQLPPRHAVTAVTPQSGVSWNRRVQGETEVVCGVSVCLHSVPLHCYVMDARSQGLCLLLRTYKSLRAVVKASGVQSVALSWLHCCSVLCMSIVLSCQWCIQSRSVKYGVGCTRRLRLPDRRLNGLR